MLWGFFHQGSNEVVKIQRVYHWTIVNDSSDFIEIKARGNGLWTRVVEPTIQSYSRLGNAFRSFSLAKGRQKFPLLAERVA